MDQYQGECCPEEAECFCVRVVLSGMKNLSVGGTGTGTGEEGECLCCEDLNGEYHLEYQGIPSVDLLDPPRLPIEITEIAQQAILLDNKPCIWWKGSRRILGPAEYCCHQGLYLVMVGGRGRNPGWVGRTCKDFRVDFYLFMYSGLPLPHTIDTDDVLYICMFEDLCNPKELTYACYKWTATLYPSEEEILIPRDLPTCRTYFDRLVEEQIFFLPVNCDDEGTEGTGGTGDSLAATVCDYSDSYATASLADSDDDCLAPIALDCETTCVYIYLDGLASPPEGEPGDWECADGWPDIEAYRPECDCIGPIFLQRMTSDGPGWATPNYQPDIVGTGGVDWRWVVVQLRKDVRTGDIWLFAFLSIGGPYRVTFGKLVFSNTGTGTDAGTGTGTEGFDCLDLHDISLPRITSCGDTVCNIESIDLRVTFIDTNGEDWDQEIDCNQCGECQETPYAFKITVTFGEYDDCPYVPIGGTYYLYPESFGDSSCSWGMSYAAMDTEPTVGDFRWSLAISGGSCTIEWEGYIQGPINQFWVTITWSADVGGVDECGNWFCQNISGVADCQGIIPEGVGCTCKGAEIPGDLIPDIYVEGLTY